MREFCDAPPIPSVYTNLITVMASKITSSLHCQITKVVQWHEPPWTVTTVRVSYRILLTSHITPTRESSLKSLCHNTSNIRSIELVIVCRSTFLFLPEFWLWNGKEKGSWTEQKRESCHLREWNDDIQILRLIARKLSACQLIKAIS